MTGIGFGWLCQGTKKARRDDGPVHGGLIVKRDQPQPMATVSLVYYGSILGRTKPCGRP